jgi:hypothetical protein
MKIFKVEDMHWVLTDTVENAFKICMDEEVIDEETKIDDILIKECNYKSKTFQPLETVNEIFTKDEIIDIKEKIQNYISHYKLDKNGVKYVFEENEYYDDKVHVLLSYYQIMNTPEIYKKFEENSIIATTEF